MLSLRAFAAAATLWLVALSCPGLAVAQNVSASQVRLLPALPPFACPAGRVCLVGDASKSPYRAAFVDAAGGVAGAGDSWRLRLYPGTPPGALNGDIWYDTVAHAAYVQQNGVPTGVGPLAFGPQLAGVVFAGPCSGAAASATFRTLCSADLTAALTTPPAFGQVTPGLVKGTLVEAVTNFVGSCSGCTNIPGSQIVGPIPVGTLPAHASTHQPGGSDPLLTAAPVTIGSANAAGSSPNLARADHVHDHGSQAGGSAHAVAVAGSSAGFLSAADKTKLDALPSALSLPLSKANGGFGSDVSTGLTANYVAIVAGGAITIGPLLAAALPTGIDAAKIGPGTVSNTIFGYISTLTSDAQAQINALLPASSTKLPPAPSGAGGTLYDSGTAWLRLAAGTANYIYQANGAAPPSWVNSLTGITISCSSNTCSNIANAALTNSSITLTCTGLSGCGTVSLGATLTPTVIYGTGANTATQGNDTRLPPAPTVANKLLYDTGTTYAETAACSSASTVLVGGSPPACASVPDAALSANVVSLTGSQTLTNKTLTSPAISSPTFSGTEGGTRTIGGTPTLGVNLAAGGFKVTGLGAPTAASSDAATATYAEAQKTGSATPYFALNTGQGFVANGYVGIANDGSSTLSANITPWRVPAAGVIKNLYVFGLSNAPSTLHILLYRATSPTTSPTYSATALDATVSSGTNTGSDTTAGHAVSVNAGDLIVGFSNTTWNVNGAQISAIYIPN